MKHIDEFRINKFRGLRNLTIEELGQVNLFVGDNNSGKTSVLEAFSLFCDPLSWRKWNDISSHREVLSSFRSSIRDRITWLFGQPTELDKNESEKSPLLLSASGSTYIKEVSATYDISHEIISTEISERLNPRYIENVEDKAEEETESIRVHVSVATDPAQSLFEEDAKKDVDLNFNDIAYLNREIKRKAVITLSAQMVNPYTHRTSSLSSRLWSEVVEANLKEETIQLLRHFDPEILDVDFISPTERRQFISVKHKSLGRAPLYTFGDGLRRVFTLATTIPRVRGGFLLIDELETAIHTRALERTFEWLVKACIANDVQLLATTHSLEALDAILEVSKERADIVVYRLQQGAEKTIAKRFDKETALRLREELGMELR